MSFRWWGKVARGIATAAGLVVLSLGSGCDDDGLQEPTDGGGGEGRQGGEHEAGAPPLFPTTSSSGGGPGTAEANAGPDLTVDTNASIFLDGSGSFSREREPLTYAWRQTSGPEAELFVANSAGAYANAPSVPGTLTFELVVSDSEGESRPDQAAVIVRNRLPKGHAGPDRSGLGGEVVTLAGAGMDPESLPITFAWTQISGPTVALSDVTAAGPTLVVPADLDQPLVFELVVSDSYDVAAPDWVTVRRVSGPDADDDLLSDDEEVAMGTDPADADTDRDGIPDSWEALGHEGVDYPAIGCDPLHKDLLVEVDYQDYIDADGAHQVAQLHPYVVERLRAFYGSMPLANPDGAPGITLHLLLDSTLPQDFVCTYGLAPGDPSPANFLYREAFHKLALCRGGGGYADIGGRNLWVNVGPVNDDPSDDATEPSLFTQYMLFIHEMGHNFGLYHGGDELANHKPNYPSVMNYAYDYGLDPLPDNLEAPDIDFSHGTLPSLDECALVELGALAAGPEETRLALTAYHPEPFQVGADGSVDFNHDGVISSEPYELILADGTECGVIHDYDDYAALATGVGSAIPSDPHSLAPFALWFEDEVEQAP